jgi:hypothetical protein
MFGNILVFLQAFFEPIFCMADSVTGTGTGGGVGGDTGGEPPTKRARHGDGKVPQILPNNLGSIRLKDYPDIDEMPPKVLELWSFKEFLFRLHMAKDLGTPHYDDLPELRKNWVNLMKETSIKPGNTRMDNEREALSVIAHILHYFEKDLGHYELVSKKDGVITLSGHEIPRLYDMGYIREIAHADDQAKMEKLLSDLLCGHELKIKVVT